MSLARAHSNLKRPGEDTRGDIGMRRSARVSTTPVGWVPSGRDMDHPQWVAVGRRLGGISRSNQWWLGDWLRYGTAKWGERYVEAAKITGYDVRSLANMASLAGCFHISRRRDNLTWSHHAVVAGLAQDEQEKWLDMAAAAKLSVADLRIELRSVERQRAPHERAHTESEEVEALGFTCPRCGYRASVGRAGD